MDIDRIIDALGGTSQVQILLGVGPSAVSNYRVRGSFPEYARVRIWQALKAKGIHVDPETLEINDPSEKQASTNLSPEALITGIPLHMPLTR